MNAGQYWKNRLPFLCAQLLGMTALSVFLLINGNSRDVTAAILLVWLFALAVCMFCSFYVRKKRLERLLSLAEDLEEKYLIPEIIQNLQRRKKKSGIAFSRWQADPCWSRLERLRGRERNTGNI